jgi:hypothetical protein
VDPDQELSLGSIMQRTLLAIGLTILFVARAAAAPETIDPAQAKADGKDSLLWYDIRLLGVEGKGWTETKGPFDRLPAKAEGMVRAPVWNLSRHSAGMAVRFVTDATTILARWTYVRQDGRWRWTGAAFREGGHPASPARRRLARRQA